MKLKMGQIQLHVTVKIINPSEIPNVLLLQFKVSLGGLTIST